MKHDWTPGLCLYCGNFCTQCNDCQCPGRGWRNYAASKCPGFDTQAGWLRPPKPGTEMKETGDAAARPSRR
jgi:hypothetical protein